MIITVENICSFPYNLPGRVPIRFSSALQTHSSGMEHDFIKLCWNFLPGLHETNCRCEIFFFSTSLHCTVIFINSSLLSNQRKLQKIHFLLSTSPFTNKNRLICTLGVLIFDHFLSSNLSTRKITNLQK